MNTEAATDLLTDIIAQTNKFQHPKVSSQSLKIASILVEKGADYQKASQKQNNQRSLSSLYLWGEVLSNLTCDNEVGTCWSVLAESCFIKTKTTPMQIPRLLLQLRNYIYPKETVIILWSDPPQTKSRSLFGNRALILSSRTNFSAYLQPIEFVQKNIFLATYLQDKEIFEASNDLIEHLGFALSKKS
ncbi:MAG: hypothetical protein HYV65_01650 [Candidatus Spechtbacteria bacterium]|nr:hypothetical protein [Candidatus Spechtbacteria bacterium]